MNVIMNNTTDTNMTINWASIVVFIVVFIVVAFDGVGSIALVAVAAGVTTIFISSININGIIEAPTMTTMQRNGTGDMNAIKREKLKDLKVCINVMDHSFRRKRGVHLGFNLQPSLVINVSNHNAVPHLLSHS